MADLEWLKQLAQARWEGGAWVVADQASLRLRLAQRLEVALEELMETAEEAAEVLADQSHQRLRISVLPLQHQATGQGERGFILLLGRCQLTLVYRPPYLDSSLVTVQGFERKTRPLYRFTPEADAFGSLAWRHDNALLMGAELIIKRLFEALTRAAYEVGDLSSGG